MMNGFASPRPLAGGEGGARRGGAGRVRWVAPRFGAQGLPYLTPTLSCPEGGEGDTPVPSRGEACHLGRSPRSGGDAADGAADRYRCRDGRARGIGFCAGVVAG